MGLFFAADPVVKFVILLVGASVWCWAIIFEKIRLIRRQKKHAAAFDELFWSGGSLNDLYNQTEMSRKRASQSICMAMREWRRQR